MAYAYNDIRNQEWYNRLIRNIQSKATTSKLRTGSEYTDPYWQAVQAQEIGDVQAARQDAFKQARLRAQAAQSAMGEQMRLREQARQRIISAALRRQPQQYEGTPLSSMTQGEAQPLQAPSLGQGQSLDQMSPQPAPEYYTPTQGIEQPANIGLGGQANITGGGLFYYPQQFYNKGLYKRKRGLAEIKTNLARSLYK